jgi:DNA-binding MarR family transcriptional regulator
MTTQRSKTGKVSRKTEEPAAAQPPPEVPIPETHPTFSFDDYDNVIGFVVSQASYRLAQALDEVIANLGSDIRPREFPILNRLHQHGALNQVQLADLTYKDRPAITRMLDRLIARKLVSKVPDPMDRRAFVVSLTPRGAALRNNIVPLMVARLQSACGGIPQKNLDIAVATLKQISSQI